MLRRTFPVLLAIALSVACGKDNSPTGPSPTSPTPTPVAPARVTVFGVVRSTLGGPAVGVTVRVTSTGSSGSTTTDGNGYYSLGNVQAGAVTLALSGTGYVSRSDTFSAPADTQRDLEIEGLALVNRSGVGNTVFDIPVREMRLRITGNYTGDGSNFIMWIGGRLVVNEIIGARRPDGTRYEGVHLVQGGIVEIKSSTGVAWSITEVR